MITNEVQYRATKAHLERFDQAAANLAAKPGTRTKLDQLELDAVHAQAEDLRAEIVEYEQLRNGEQSILTAGSLAELSTLFVKARIARGWTQRQLAETLGMGALSMSATNLMPRSLVRPGSQPGSASSSDVVAARRAR